MRTVIGFLLAAVALPSWGWAQTPASTPAPAKRQLVGIDAQEAAALLAKLTAAQAALRSGGKFQSFKLLAGSVASYDETRLSPRDVFLGTPFDKVWKIERVQPDRTPLTTFSLSYAPKGLGQLYWEILVALSDGGAIESVTLTYKPPAPF